MTLVPPGDIDVPPLCPGVTLTLSTGSGASIRALAPSVDRRLTAAAAADDDDAAAAEAAGARGVALSRGQSNKSPPLPPTAADSGESRLPLGVI